MLEQNLVNSRYKKLWMQVAVKPNKEGRKEVLHNLTLSPLNGCPRWGTANHSSAWLIPLWQLHGHFRHWHCPLRNMLYLLKLVVGHPPPVSGYWLVLARHFHDSLLISQSNLTQPVPATYTTAKQSLHRHKLLYSYPNKDISSVECIVLYIIVTFEHQRNHM